MWVLHFTELFGVFKNKKNFTICVRTWLIVQLEVMAVGLISKYWTVIQYFFAFILSNNSKSVLLRCCYFRPTPISLSPNYWSEQRDRSQYIERASVHRRAFSSALLSTLTLMCQFASWWIISSVGEWSRPAATWCKWRFGLGVDHRGSSLARAPRPDAEASN